MFVTCFYVCYMFLCLLHVSIFVTCFYICYMFLCLLHASMFVTCFYVCYIFLYLLWICVHIKSNPYYYVKSKIKSYFLVLRCCHSMKVYISISKERSTDCFASSWSCKPKGPVTH